MGVPRPEGVWEGGSVSCNMAAQGFPPPLGKAAPVSGVAAASSCGQRPLQRAYPCGGLELDAGSSRGPTATGTPPWASPASSQPLQQLLGGLASRGGSAHTPATAASPPASLTHPERSLARPLLGPGMKAGSSRSRTSECGPAGDDPGIEPRHTNTHFLECTLFLRPTHLTPFSQHKLWRAVYFGARFMSGQPRFTALLISQFQKASIHQELPAGHFATLCASAARMGTLRRRRRKTLLETPNQPCISPLL